MVKVGKHYKTVKERSIRKSGRCSKCGGVTRGITKIIRECVACDYTFSVE